MEILVTVLAILSLIFATFVIIEKIIFDRKIHSTDIGMTGRDVEDCTGLKLHILKVDGATYYAHIYSKFNNTFLNTISFIITNRLSYTINAVLIKYIFIYQTSNVKTDKWVNNYDEK